MVDGWFRTGDLGTIDEDGFVFIVDRKKDLVIRGGFNVYPREVEEVLMRYPEVVQVAVVGLPDDTYGEEICAVIVTKEGAQVDADAVIEWSKEHLGRHKYPRSVRFVPMPADGPERQDPQARDRPHPQRREPRLTSTSLPKWLLLNAGSDHHGSDAVSRSTSCSTRASIEGSRSA